jgi:hypothetical protein
MRALRSLMSAGTLLSILACSHHNGGGAGGDAGEGGVVDGGPDATPYDGGTDSTDGGACEQAGPLDVNYGSDAYVTCWVASYSTSGVTLAGSAPGSGFLRQVTITVSSVCGTQSGSVINLTSDCVDIEGDIWEANAPTQFTISSNASTLGVSATGSMTIGQWPSGPGQGVTISFSSDATVGAGGNDGASPGPAKISGSLTLTVSQ